VIICVVRPIIDTTSNPHITKDDLWVAAGLNSSGLVFISSMKGFVHLGLYASKRRSEYGTKSNAPRSAGNVATTGRKHGVKRAFR
jgi:hypothetical protein